MAKKRVFISYDTFLQIDSPLNCEFVNDIAVSGWAMADSKIKSTGYLSVWIVSNSGKVLV